MTDDIDSSARDDQRDEHDDQHRGVAVVLGRPGTATIVRTHLPGDPGYAKRPPR